LQTRLTAEWLLLQRDRCHSVPAVLKRKHYFRGNKEKQGKTEQREAEFVLDLKFKEINRNGINTRHTKTSSNSPPSYWVLSFPSVTHHLAKGTELALPNPCPKHTGGFGSLDNTPNDFSALLHCGDYNPEAVGRA